MRHKSFFMFVVCSVNRLRLILLAPSRNAFDSKYTEKGKPLGPATFTFLYLLLVDMASLTWLRL